MSLTLRIFGSPRVSIQGQVIKFRSRKVLALLVYLLTTRERHSRDSLMSLLWPDSDRKRASQSLRNAFSHLRQSLKKQDGNLDLSKKN